MLLIAESGSTKTDWRLVSEDKKIVQFQTKGINPNHQNFEQIREQLRSELLPELPKGNIDNIYFYGAGFSNLEYNKRMETVFTDLLPATKAEVQHDMLGAARALCGKQPGIACILGTGSNSCVFDGSEITNQAGGHGYILGDEGSGADLGKRFMKALLDRELSEQIKVDFEKYMSRNLEQIKLDFYKSAKPNTYLAAFSKYIIKHIRDKAVAKIIVNSFQSFFDKTVCQYESHEQIPVHFVGSVAFHYQDIIKHVCKNNQFIIGNFIERPIAALTLYHIENK